MKTTLAQDATRRPDVNADLLRMERDHERKMKAIQKEMVGAG